MSNERTGDAASEYDLVVVGQIRTAFGVRGWLKLMSFTEPMDNIFSYRPWYVKGPSGWEEKTIEAKTVAANGLTVKFEGLDDRELARLYANAEIAVRAGQLPALADDEYYWRDLEGCRVINAEGYDLGIVDHLIETGANDVLVVTANANDAFGQKQRLIPFVLDEVVTQVDIPNRRLTVIWDPDF